MMRFAKRDIRQRLADLAGGKRGGCVQIIMHSNHSLPIAKLRCETSMGRSLLRANRAG